MKNLSAWQLILLLSFTVLYTSFIPFEQPATIKGSVIADGTDVPVANAYVYILAGEEEAISGQNGNFELKTWQSFPVRCTVEHKNFSRQIVLVKQAGTVSVKLQAK